MTRTEKFLRFLRKSIDRKILKISVARLGFTVRCPKCNQWHDPDDYRDHLFWQRKEDINTYIYMYDCPNCFTVSKWDFDNPTAQLVKDRI